MLFVLDWGRVGNDPPSGVRFWVTGQKTLGNIAKDNSLSPDQTRGTMSHKGRKWCGHRSTWATKTLSRSATDPNRNPKFCLPVIQFFSPIDCRQVACRTEISLFYQSHPDS